METVEIARESLDAMLGYLGFTVQVEIEPDGDGGALQVSTEDGELLVGQHGERLEDIAYLVNRILHHRHRDAPRVRVDIAHYRRMRDDRLIEGVRVLAERVRATGKPLKSDLLNSYHRRLIHSTYQDDADIETSSPPGRDRLKRVTLRRRVS